MDTGECFNECTSHGRCARGICVCDEGWRGYDCRETTRGFLYLLSPPASKGLERMRSMHARSDPIYHSEYFFFHWFVRDPWLRSADRSTARLVYIPAWTYYQLNNVAFGDRSLADLEKYVDTHHNVSRRQRVYFLSGDKGACRAKSGPVFLSHWGLRVPWEHMLEPSRYTRTTSTPPCADARHVVVPMYFDYRKAATTVDRRTTFRCELAFGGSRQLRWTGPSYSQGVRQLVFDTHQTTPGFCVRRRVTTEEVRESKFCLVVSGDGFGSRLFHALRNLCVPLIIQPNVSLPFEPLIPYGEFSVRLEKRQIGDLPSLVRRYTADQIYAMRQRLLYWRPAFDWRADAYAFTRYLLCLRAFDQRAVSCAHLRPSLLSP